MTKFNEYAIKSRAERLGKNEKPKLPDYKTPKWRVGKQYPSKELIASKTSKKERQVYTGTLIKGISQMHKSNAVPVIDQQQILDIARMRR
jgi:hypothetical protein